MSHFARCQLLCKAVIFDGLLMLLRLQKPAFFRLFLNSSGPYGVVIGLNH